MNYFDQLKHAARIFRHTKALWLLGMLAALFGQNEYGFSVNYSEPAPVSSQSGAPFAGVLANPLVASFMANPVAYIVGIGALAIAGWVIATLVGWLVQGAMIHAVTQAELGVSPSVRGSLRRSREQLVPLFLLHLMLSIPSIVAIGLAALLIVPLLLSLFSSTPDFATLFPRFFGVLICLLPLFLLNGLASIVLKMINIFGARACVVERLGVRASFRQGWLMLRHNAGYSALNWFVFLIFGAVFGLVAAVPALLLLMPAARAFLHNDWTPLTLSAAIGLGIYFVLLSLGLGGILTGFNSTVWTVLYQSFQRKAEAFSDGAIHATV